MQNNVFIISIIWLHNLIDTITIIGRHSPLSRGGHFVSGDQEKFCLCTASLVERTRVAVHKQSFLNLLRQNGGRVAKVYYDVILVNLLAGPNFQFLPWPKILIKIVRCAMKSRSWLTHFESLTFAVKKANKKPPRSKWVWVLLAPRKECQAFKKKIVFQQFSIVLFYLCVATLQ